MISYIEVYKIGAKTKTSVFLHHFAKLWKTKNNTITMKKYHFADTTPSVPCKNKLIFYKQYNRKGKQ